MNNFAMVKKIKPDYTTGPLRKAIPICYWGEWGKQNRKTGRLSVNFPFEAWVCANELAKLFDGLWAVESIQINAYRKKPHTQAVKIYIEKRGECLLWNTSTPLYRANIFTLSIDQFLYEEVGFSSEHKTEDEFWVEVEILD